MSGEVFAALRAKEDARLPRIANLVERDEVVGVAVADRDAEAVALDVVLFREAVLDAPAKEDADVVVPELVVAHDGALRARAGVQAELGVVLGGAALGEDVVANLPADAVAVVVARDDAAENEAVAVLEEEAAAVVAVEVLVLLAVAVERQVFDPGVGDVLPGDEGEDGHRDGVAHAPEVF